MDCDPPPLPTEPAPQPPAPTEPPPPPPAPTDGDPITVDSSSPASPGNHITVDSSSASPRNPITIITVDYTTVDSIIDVVAIFSATSTDGFTHTRPADGSTHTHPVTTSSDGSTSHTWPITACTAAKSLINRCGPAALDGTSLLPSLLPIQVTLSAILFASCSALNLTVGDSMWTIPLSSEFYADWSNNRSFIVGDSLIFKSETGFYNVMEVTRSEFDSCIATENQFRRFDSNPTTFIVNFTSFAVSGITAALG